MSPNISATRKGTLVNTGESEAGRAMLETLKAQGLGLTNRQACAGYGELLSDMIGY